MAMRRRSTASSKRANARSRKAETLKAVRHSSSSASGQETQVARLTRERDEALLRETANSEILRLISRSPGDLESVFRSILENATRICNANFGTLFRFDGENFYPVAQFNTPAALLEALTRRGPFKPTPGIPLDHVMRTKQLAHSADMAAEPTPGLSTKLGGARTQVIVPMLKGDALIGAILIYRQEVRPFTDKQIALLQNFAAQAVIAIENARLLNELRQSLEQQTATADVLRVISSSPGELKPVFHSMLEKATRLCGASFGTLFLIEGESFRRVALHNAPAKYAEFTDENPLIPYHQSRSLTRLTETKQTVHVTDMMVEEPETPVTKFGSARSLVVVPMLQENELGGAIGIFRQEVWPFTDKQIELVTNFAAQAVIAIENAR